MAWHRRAWAGPALRLIGAGLLGCAYLLVTLLFSRYGPVSPAAPLAMTYPIAAASFACASAGGALLMLGAHLFDEVEVSERWTQRHFPVGPDADLIGWRAQPRMDAVDEREMALDAHR